MDFHGADVEEAISAYERALVAEPGFPKALLALDGLLEREQRWVALADLLEREVEDSSGDSLLANRLRLASVLSKGVGRVEEAVDVLSVALREHPDSQECAKALEELAQEEPLVRQRVVEMLEPLFSASRSPEERLRLLDLGVSPDTEQEQGREWLYDGAVLAL